MKRVIPFLALALVFAACGDDSGNDDAATAATTTSTTGAVSSATAPTKSTTKPVTTSKPPTTFANDTRAPADSQSPAAGACAEAKDGYADFKLNPDVPAPRCVILHDTDHLRVTNAMEVSVDVDDGVGGFVVQPGDTFTGMKAIGSYWQPGVHVLKIRNSATKAALYGGGGPEAWLK